MGLCPFHTEKSPSFSVSPSKQFYHCFGCGASGDAVRFLTEHLGQSFVEAVRDLAQSAGMQVPEDDVAPQERERREGLRQRRLTLASMLAKASEYYRAQLKSGPRAIDYLKQRGLTGVIAARFGLGYAPPGRRALAGVFAEYSDPMLEEGGLVRRKGDDEAEVERYDWFRDRIMFPIRSVDGAVIGFGGRVLDHSQPKYLNSPETPVFSKGRELYGLHEARIGLRERGYALVVEGYMDVLALAQSGFGNAVATLGTACTAEHVQKLFRFTDSVVFSFDGDAAGRGAARRALEASLPHASDLRSIRFLFLPPEHDPDSFVRKLGAAAFEAAVAQAQPLSRQLILHAAEGADLDTAEGRARLVAQATPLWQALPEGTLRDQVLGEVAERARLPREDLAHRWGRGGRRAPGDIHRSAGREPRRHLRPRVAAMQPQDQVLRIVLQRSDWWDELPAIDHETLMTLPEWHSTCFRWLERWLSEHGPTPWPGLREVVAAEPWGAQAVALVDGVELTVEPLLEDLRHAVHQARRATTLQQAMSVLGRR